MSTYLKSLARRLSPPQIPVFPLSGTVLLPGCELPLNIFEPRYLNMIDDALRGERLIGMVQPAHALSGESEGGFVPELALVGGLGRIKQFSETEDGRYLIVLMGLKRFEITGRADVSTPYRQALVSYDKFSGDIEVHDSRLQPRALTEPDGERARLTLAMKGFAKSLGVEVDWDALGTIAMAQLVDQTAMISPFNAFDKQSLLEAEGADNRRRLLIALMELYTQNGANDDLSGGSSKNAKPRKDLQ